VKVAGSRKEIDAPLAPPIIWRQPSVLRSIGRPVSKTYIRPDANAPPVGLVAPPPPAPTIVTLAFGPTAFVENAPTSEVVVLERVRV
jgi:hypothetical protein